MDGMRPPTWLSLCSLAHFRTRDRLHVYMIIFCTPIVLGRPTGRRATGRHRYEMPCLISYRRCSSTLFVGRLLASASRLQVPVYHPFTNHCDQLPTPLPSPAVVFLLEASRAPPKRSGRLLVLSSVNGETFVERHLALCPSVS